MGLESWFPGDDGLTVEGRVGSRPDRKTRAGARSRETDKE